MVFSDSLFLFFSFCLYSLRWHFFFFVVVVVVVFCLRLKTYTSEKVMPSSNDNPPSREDFIKTLSFEIASALCRKSTIYIERIQLKKQENGNVNKYFLRARFSLDQNEVRAERLYECSYANFGAFLQENLERTTVNTHYSPSALCWLTVVSSDGELALQHAFFRIAQGSLEPIGFSCSHFIGVARENENTQGNAQPASSPQSKPPLRELSVNCFTPPAECSSVAPSPSLTGRSQNEISQAATRLQLILPQDFVPKREPNPFFSLSLALPRLQSSAPYVPCPQNEKTQRLMIQDKQLMVIPEETVLIDPSSYTHQSPDGVRHQSLSPYREKLWTEAEKSMTRYTGFRILDLEE